MYSFNKATKSFIETNPLLLSTEWSEAGGDKAFARRATIKIFNNHEEYRKYENPDQSDQNKNG